MALEDPQMPDADKIQDLVTFDIVPELESYLHTIAKDLHSSIDKIESTLVERRRELASG